MFGGANEWMEKKSFSGTPNDTVNTVLGFKASLGLHDDTQSSSKLKA